jgi:hypothetical protein
VAVVRCSPVTINTPMSYILSMMCGNESGGKDLL